MAIEERDKSDDLEGEARYIGGVIKRVSNFNMETLNGRKIFQKTTYLIQAFGIELGYEFNWYLYGVYSPDLADVGYKLQDIYDDVSESKFTNEENEKRFQEFLEFITPMKEDVHRLMINSSLHYLQEQNPDLHRDQLIEFLIEEKDLSDEKFDECVEEWQRMKDYGLV